MSSCRKRILEIPDILWDDESGGSIHVRVVPLEATSERAAWREAQNLCEGTEFVRGIMTVYPDADEDA